MTAENDANHGKKPPAGLSAGTGPGGLDRDGLLSAIVDSSSDAIISKRLDGVVLSWNAGAERLFGYCAREMIGDSIRKLFPPERLTEEDDIIARISRGENVKSFETVRRRKDGSMVEISVSISPVRDADGRIFGASKIARDITERKEAQRRIELLVRELHHRSRNLLAVVQSVANLTAAQSPGEFVPRFMERLQAMSRNHDLLVRSDHESAKVRDIISVLVEPFSDVVGTRIRFDGPDLRLNAKATQYFGLALHELLTNSVAYGALAGPSGDIEIGWRHAGENFEFDWRETGAPAARIGKAGFGTTVLTQITGPTLHGVSNFSVKEGDVHWTLRWPGKAFADA